MHMDDIELIRRQVRALNYISAAQIYLQDNFLLGRKLSFEDIKPRLLGHWGTCPGINFVYANLNHLIKKHRAEMLFVLGPGHGFPALQANLFLEGTLGRFYPEATRDLSGLGYICKNFSWPYGFPSHSNPGTPGVILEGGELGYSLSTAYGAVLDNPNLTAVCLVGDGEAETGPMATSWHVNKFLDPATNGAVLPILHLNGYKISGPTVFGRMTNRELKSLFYGYGYEPYVVEGNDPYEKMAVILEECYSKIRAIQESARSRKPMESPRFPMIVLRTPKGWTGIKKLKGNKIEGNCLSHQVVGTSAKTDKVELKAIEKWMRSYKFEELFSADRGFAEDALANLPEDGRKMGESPYALGEKTLELKLPSADKFAEDAKVPGTIGSSSMRRAGAYLLDVFRMNKDSRNFRLFSPDETYSNKLDQVFEETARPFVWPIKEWDKDLRPDGRVLEMLSEHTLQGLIEGYILTGRHAIFASYEAFIQIISSMADQYVKFLSAAKDISWRKKTPSLNYILTSSGWRQEHNGFSHQNPGFISDILQKPGSLINVYFPPDGNTTLAVLEECLSSKQKVNVIVAGKTQEPRWLTPELAREELRHGIMVWDFASDLNPDIVLSGTGDYLTKEALAAIDIAKTEAPEIKIRFVNILTLSSLGIGAHGIKEKFADYFTEDKPVIFNFHGYPQTLKQLLFNHQDGSSRFSVHGYTEHGSTTTPFDMHVRNSTSRYHLAMEVFEKMAERGVLDKNKAADLNRKYGEKLHAHGEFIRKFGVDPEDIENWVWKAK